MVEVVHNVGTKDVSLRAITFKTFQLTLESLQDDNGKKPILKNNCLIVLTNFGQIFCPVGKNTTEDELGGVIVDSALKARDTVFENQLSDTSVKNDCDALILTNVIVVPFENPRVRLKYGVMMLFVDQIAGISIGQFPDECN